jgi:hypothetical protein
MLNDGRNSNEQPASKSKKPHQAGEGTAAPIKGKVVRRADRAPLHTTTTVLLHCEEKIWI